MRKFAGGVVRRDYHRPNRKANKSMHRHSHGGNVPVSATLDPSALYVPEIPRDELIRRANAHWRNRNPVAGERAHARHSVEKKCFEYIRHQQTTFDRAIKRLYGAAYLIAVREFCDAVTERYEWLRDECNRYYDRKAIERKFNTFRVIKRQSLTSLHVEEFNERENQKPEVPLTEEEEVPLFFQQMNSLDQSRFLYLPPFLKPDQVRERRFGEDANDRWWEWEEELGLESTTGRHNPMNAQQ